MERVLSLLPLWLVLGIAAAAPAPAARTRPIPGLSQWRARRRALAHRPLGIIANNDGCDVLYFPKNQRLTRQSFLARRTAALAGTEVGAIAYCTISSGFSFFTHDTRAGTLLTRQPEDFGLGRGRRNVARDLIDLGADCLTVVTDFAHAHHMLAFWSMRMNDTHDAAYRPGKPYLLYPPLKKNHPDWLVGKVGGPTQCGTWSSVNYALKPIRDAAFAFIREVCTHYDVDGVELDFFRHLCYFPSTAEGKSATEAERQAMTGLIRRIRKMTETVGRRRGRPILISIRVPDSIGYDRAMGLDVEQWLREGLVDILITTGYFRLNPWEYTVKLARKYGVAAYPCLSDSRVRAQKRFFRGSLQGYRGRAANAWAAHPDGIHIFNYFNPHAALWKEIGSPKTLIGRDKLFFVTVRDGSPDYWLAGGDRFRNTPVLTPTRPLLLSPGKSRTVPLTVGEDFAAAAAVGFVPHATLHIRMLGRIPPKRLELTFNDRALPAGAPRGDWLDYPIAPQKIRRGLNRIRLALRPPAASNPSAPWNIEYTAAHLPKSPWLKDRPATHTVVKLENRALLIADRGSSPGDYCYYRIPWGMGRDGDVVIQACLKVKSGVSCLLFGNGTTGQRLCFYPDRIQFYHNRSVRYRMNTTDRFHTYRLQIHGRDISVFVDGALCLAGKNCFSGKRPTYRNELAFGAANSDDRGEAWWRSVRARLDTAACGDIVLSVHYTHPAAARGTDSDHSRSGH